MRRLVLAICLAVSVGACNAPIAAGPTSSPTQPPVPSSPSTFDATGILLVGVGERVQPAPPTEALHAAFGDALAMVDAHPDDLGYPWIDSSNEVVVSAATQRGRALLEAATIAVPHRIRDVVHSAAELQRIQDDATFLQTQGVPDAELIFKIVPDQRDNRTLIFVRTMSRPLLAALAGRFPVDAIAVEVSPLQ